MALADTRQREAQERHTEADRIDPDVEEREALERDEHEQDARDPGGITSHGRDA